MYELSQVISNHQRDLRCLDYYRNTLITGGSDKVFNLYTYSHGHLTLITKFDAFEKNILSVRLNKVNESEVCALVGCMDGNTYAIDHNGSPLYTYPHESAISSIDFIDDNHFVAGSWDGKAIVWQIKNLKKIAEFNEHKHAVAVYYNPLNNAVVSGSQDKALNVWSWHNGHKIQRLQNAHQDIIRQIVKVENIGFATCSNDETVKVWSSDLELIQSLAGHSGFIFTAKCLGLGRYISGGDGKIVKVWNNETCQQDIALPSQIWSLAVNDQGDILAGCSDGSLRIFSIDPTRKAPPQVLEIHNTQVLQAASKRSGMKASDIQKLPTLKQLSNLQDDVDVIKGRKEGDVKVFRNQQIPECYMWQNGRWEKIGEVLTQPSGRSDPRYYQGDKFFEAGQYDYVFDVDDESGVPKLIPFNKGGNALEAAEKYCKRQGLSIYYVEQIRRFLMQNTQPGGNQGKMENQHQPSTFTSELEGTPAMGIIEFTDVKNPQGLLKKLKEFNEAVEVAKKLSQKELAYAQRQFVPYLRITKALETSSTYHSWKLDFKEMDTVKKLLGWPLQCKLPVWDLLRAFLKHYQSEQLFSGLDAGSSIIYSLAAGLQSDSPEVLYTLILKVLSNSMIQHTNKNGILKNYQMVFQALKQISKRELCSKNYLQAMATLLFNFSVVCLQKAVEQPEMLQAFADVIQLRLQCDQTEQNRTLLLQAGANILYKHKQQVANYKFLQQFLQGDGPSKDIQVLLK